jgi:sec-independent protein translocase protein TatC
VTTPARRQKKPTKFQQAADGSMTLIEHIRELRNRLTKAVIAILAGIGVGLFFAQDIFDVIKKPYCAIDPQHTHDCGFVALGITDPFTLKLRLALYAGLVLAAPFWLYQLWAFVAPGLHKHERKWAYLFASIAGPLFFLGAFMAYFVVGKGMQFLINAGVGGFSLTLEITKYVSFVINLVLLFGLSFEFPVLLLLLNFTGVVSGKKMLGWWRIAVLLCFAFAAITTPDPGPFGMTLLAAALSVLYFGAVAVALLNDKRRNRKNRKLYGDLSDDETSALDYDPEPIEAAEPIEVPSDIAPPTPVEERRSRWDDMT